MTLESLTAARPVLDLSLYLVTISLDEQRDDDRIVATCQAAVAGGVTLIQLRDKHASTAQRTALARRIIAAIDRAVPVLINDDIEAALRAGAEGAHIGQEDLSPLDARGRLGPNRLLGLSVHNDAELDYALSQPAGTLDYIGLGAVYPTQTKEVQVLGIDGLRHLAARARANGMPCVAIGGIDSGRLAEVAATDADGVAVVSAICAQRAPKEAARALRSQWQQLRTPRDTHRSSIDTPSA